MLDRRFPKSSILKIIFYNFKKYVMKKILNEERENFMKPKILLRIASALMLIHLIGHSFGNAMWKKSNDSLKKQVIQTITENKFLFMGTNRSFADNFDGYGYATSLFLVLIIVLLWFISNSLKTITTLTIKILLLLFICLLGLSMDEFIYFFPFAAGLSLSASILIGIATLQLKKLL